MDSVRFDRFSKLFSQRRLNRRDALRAGSTGLAATALTVTGLAAASSAAAQDATPAADESAAAYPEMLFLQSFQAGSIVPKEGDDGRYTLTLEQGHGQTIFFSDRPDRIVGASPTDEFLEILGFADDDPPNAALVVETANGDIDVAVIELFNPVYDPTTTGVTYEVEVLANWQAELDMEFGEAPTDLAALTASFGTNNLFIDGAADCPDATMTCVSGAGKGTQVGTIANADHDGYCQSWLLPLECLPCQPWMRNGVIDYWNDQCNKRFADCQGNCQVTNWCSRGSDC